jgi:hypothetical protein
MLRWDMREPPPRKRTHNWPVYKPPRSRRPDIERYWPVLPVELEVGSRSLLPFPTCGAALTSRAKDPIDALFSDDRQNVPLCSRPAGDNTAHLGYGPCSAHAGNTSVVRRKFAREAGMHFIDKFKAEVTLFGGDPSLVSITPEEALMEEVRRSVAMVRYLQSQISQWNPGAGDLGALPSLTDETTKGQGTPTDAAEWLRLYREERAHMVRVSKMTIDAGVSLSMVALAQQQGVLVAQAVHQILTQLELTPRQAQMVPEVVPAVLAQFVRQDVGGSVTPQPVLQGVVLE